MAQLKILTAGESHGKSLVGIIDGIPAGLSLIASRDIDPILAERQKGYGRSHRQTIESDKAEITGGVRFGVTTGAPISIRIENKDSANWSSKLSVLPTDEEIQCVVIPRPGHADLSGAIKYDHQDDIRNVFERASARETAMRVALGAVCSKVLNDVGITSMSFVCSIGTTVAQHIRDSTARKELVNNSNVRMPDPEATKKSNELIDTAKKNGDTLGGLVQTEFYGLPVGIGSYVQWDRKLDGQIAQAVMSIQAVKAVEFGDGKDVAFQFGSESHDEIIIDGKTISHLTNHAGGLEGGMSNGMPIIVRASMKPISTLMRPLKSINLDNGETADAHIERSDVCAVPSLSIIVEQVVATALLSAILDTFGGDTISELHERLDQRRKKSILQ